MNGVDGGVKPIPTYTNSTPEIKDGLVSPNDETIVICK